MFRRTACMLVVLGLAASAPLGAQEMHKNAPTRPEALRAPRVSAAAAYGQLPLAFEPNLGQAERSVLFLARGAGYAVGVSADGVRLSLGAAGAGDPALVGMRLAGARTDATAVPSTGCPGTSATSSAMTHRNGSRI